MREKSISTISMAVTFVIFTITFGVLVSGVPARADDGACSNRTLRGDYGFAIEGLLLPAPGVSIPIRGVAMTHFDGQGHLHQVDHILADGVLISPLEWTPGVGSYHVNADCTGTMHIEIPTTSDFVNLNVVVVTEGKEIHVVVTPPFNGPPRTVTAAGVRRH